MRKKRNVVIVATSVLLVVMSIGLWWYLTKTPLYSLWQAQQAFAQHHLVTFEKYVDIETVIGRMIDQMSAANSLAAQKSGNLWDQLVQTISRGLAPMVKPQLVKRLKDQAEAYVVTGKFAVSRNGSGNEFFTLEHLYQMASGNNVVLKGITFVKTENQTAVVGLKLAHKVYHATLRLELVLKKRGGYWQVSEFNNLPEYMKRLGELDAEYKQAGGHK